MGIVKICESMMTNSIKKSREKIEAFYTSLAAFLPIESDFEHFRINQGINPLFGELNDHSWSTKFITFQTLYIVRKKLKYITSTMNSYKFNESRKGRHLSLAFAVAPKFSIFDLDPMWQQQNHALDEKPEQKNFNKLKELKSAFGNKQWFYEIKFITKEGKEITSYLLQFHDKTLKEIDRIHNDIEYNQESVTRIKKEIVKQELFLKVAFKLGNIKEFNEDEENSNHIPYTIYLKP